MPPSTVADMMISWGGRCPAAAARKGRTRSRHRCGGPGLERVGSPVDVEFFSDPMAPGLGRDSFVAVSSSSEYRCLVRQRHGTSQAGLKSAMG